MCSWIHLIFTNINSLQQLFYKLRAFSWNTINIHDWKGIIIHFQSLGILQMIFDYMKLQVGIF
jgi:hypothetical protein